MFEFDLRPLFVACVVLGIAIGLFIAFPGAWAASYLYHHIQWVP